MHAHLGFNDWGSFFFLVTRHCQLSWIESDEHIRITTTHLHYYYHCADSTGFGDRNVYRRNSICSGTCEYETPLFYDANFVIPSSSHALSDSSPPSVFTYSLVVLPFSQSRRPHRLHQSRTILTELSQQYGCHACLVLAVSPSVHSVAYAPLSCRCHFTPRFSTSRLRALVSSGCSICLCTAATSFSTSHFGGLPSRLFCVLLIGESPPIV